MINYLQGTDLWLYPDLACTMFHDRAIQFSRRLGWDVSVDRQGFERDQYDAINPIYVIVCHEDGCHAGSMRLLPTTGRTMINEHFLEALKGSPIHDPRTWECTRFCLSPQAGPRTAAKLFASAGRLMQEFDIMSLVAVFDPFMFRRYRVSGVAPGILGEAVTPQGKILAGRWQFSVEQLGELMRRAALDPLACELSLANSSLIQPQYRTSA